MKIATNLLGSLVLVAVGFAQASAHDDPRAHVHGAGGVSYVETPVRESTFAPAEAARRAQLALAGLLALGLLATMVRIRPARTRTA